MNIGLFFGSFNPIHLGHLIIANVLVGGADLDKIWFVVSPQNPFKGPDQLLDEFDRLEMVRAAIEDNDNFMISDMEFDMSRPSYTIDTLLHLSDQNVDHNFTPIIGEDNLPDFPKWKEYKRILDDYGLVVYPRSGGASSENMVTHPKLQMVNAPFIDISSTFIRDLAVAGKSIRYLVPDAVEKIVVEKGLYAEER